ncbi:unnamed protein product [Pleuronectes platessa]|uniref:Uncharacterized protein n=1 Tax=Pleuronectes platessa TaxID=8262 RepID=A0A9N7VHP6_PLEPL|nr:unnamed protein product [Pleuronectes platessa]
MGTWLQSGGAVPPYSLMWAVITDWSRSGLQRSVTQSGPEKAASRQRPSPRFDPLKDSQYLRCAFPPACSPLTGNDKQMIQRGVGWWGFGGGEDEFNILTETEFQRRRSGTWTECVSSKSRCAHLMDVHSWLRISVCVCAGALAQRRGGGGGGEEGGDRPTDAPTVSIQFARSRSFFCGQCASVCASGGRSPASSLPSCAPLLARDRNNGIPGAVITQRQLEPHPPRSPPSPGCAGPAHLAVENPRGWVAHCGVFVFAPVRWHNFQLLSIPFQDVHAALR